VPRAAPPAERVVTIFSHARHGAARMSKIAGGDLDGQCRSCHAEEKGGKRLAMPSEESCYRCHTRADRAAPSAKACGLCHVAKPEKTFVAATVLTREPPHDGRFYHESHRDELCATCHPIGGGREDPGRTNPGACASCHGAVKFSHEVHVRGARLDCAGCHGLEPAGSRERTCKGCGRLVDPGAAACPRCGEALPAPGPSKNGVARLMPTHAACVACHPGVSAEAPTKDCALCHDGRKLDFAGPHAVPKLARGDLVGFSHADHERSSCTACHTAEPARREGAPPVEPTMESCRTCHAGVAKFEGKTVPSACATCHASLRGPIPPRDHGELIRPIDHNDAFRRHHGDIARAPDQKCLECHDLARSCNACHALEEPRSHTLRFKRTTHGEEMAHDRAACVTCHPAAFCSDCHSLEQPPNHRYTPNWVNGGHKVYARREMKRCYVCHSFAADCSKCHP
jgi:hypothetical protein